MVSESAVYVKQENRIVLDKILHKTYKRMIIALQNMAY